MNIEDLRRRTNNLFDFVLLANARIEATQRIFFDEMTEEQRKKCETKLRKIHAKIYKEMKASMKNVDPNLYAEIYGKGYFPLKFIASTENQK